MYCTAASLLCFACQLLFQANLMFKFYQPYLANGYYSIIRAQKFIAETSIHQNNKKSWSSVMTALKSLSKVKVWVMLNFPIIPVSFSHGMCRNNTLKF